MDALASQECQKCPARAVVEADADVGNRPTVRFRKIFPITHVAAPFIGGCGTTTYRAEDGDRRELRTGKQNQAARENVEASPPTPCIKYECDLMVVYLVWKSVVK
jgi:hypothetical protein